MSVKKGDTIKVEYTGTFEDGTVFDSTEKHGQPLEFQVGSGQLIRGFDAAVVGMKVGDEKEITLQPSEAYGDPNPELVRAVPREHLPRADLKPGMMLLMSLPNGAQMPVMIAKVGDTEVTLDMNHPLAGKVLNFRIKVVAVAA